MDCKLSGFSIHRIFQARVLEYVAISFCRGSSLPRDRTWVSHIVGRQFTDWATREVPCLAIKSCQTLCYPMDCSLPGFSVHGIFPGKNTAVGCHFLLQGIFLTQGSNPCLLHWQVDSLPLTHLESLILCFSSKHSLLTNSWSSPLLCS